MFCFANVLTSCPAAIGTIGPRWCFFLMPEGSEEAKGMHRKTTILLEAHLLSKRIHSRL
jgi:hypothetical protein